MSRLLELRYISQDFRRVASHFLNTKHNDGNSYLSRFYDYINQETLIKGYVDEILTASDYDTNNFILQDRGAWDEIVVPKKEADHLKCIYILLETLVTHEPEIPLSGFSFRFRMSSSNNFDDMIRAFLSYVFTPFINYITDKIGKEMMMLEENETRGQFHPTIGVVHGTVNTGETISSINITNVTGDTQDFMALIKSLKEHEFFNICEDEDKASILDDIEQIEEQVSSSAPNKLRFTKAVSSIKKCLGSVAIKVAANAVSKQLIDNFSGIVETLENLSSKL